jgi:hypothetical protein
VRVEMTGRFFDMPMCQNKLSLCSNASGNSLRRVRFPSPACQVPKP